MSSITRRHALQAIAAGFAAVAGPARLARADASASTKAVEPVARMQEGLLAIMRAGRSTSFAQRFNMLAPVVDRCFDLSAMLAMVVGPRWETLDAPQREQLQNSFRRYTVASWVANFDADGGQTFQNLPELRPAGSGQQIVQSRLLRSSGDPVKLDFVVRPGGDGWRILDVLADGSISRLAVLRSDFRRLLSDGTGAQLTATLDRKVADLSRGALA